MSCAVCWTSTRGEADEQLRKLDFGRSSADAGLDALALYMARSGAGGAVCSSGGGLPKRVRTLCAGRGDTGFDADFAGGYIYLAARPNESGRRKWGRGSFDVGAKVHTKH